MSVYDPEWNPSPVALHALNPELVIPAEYHGVSDDIFLAELVNLMVTRGERTLDQFAADIDPEPDAPRDLRFANLAARYLIPEHLRYMILYHFRPALPKNPERETHNANYILLLAVTYRDRILDMAPTIMRFLNNVRDRENPYLSIEMIDKVIQLNSFMRAEAIMIDPDDTQYAAEHWTQKEIKNILEHGVTIQEALNFIQIGIYSADEIIANKGLLADEYMKSLLNPRG